MVENKFENNQENDIAPEIGILAAEEKDVENAEREKNADCY